MSCLRGNFVATPALVGQWTLCFGTFCRLVHLLSCSSKWLLCKIMLVRVNTVARSVTGWRAAGYLVVAEGLDGVLLLLRAL